MNYQTISPDESLPEPVTIDSKLIVKSIGYKTLPIAGVPYNLKSGTIPHEHGCVIDPLNNNSPMVGLYVAGWAKRGATGINDATLRDAKATYNLIKHHVETD